MLGAFALDFYQNAGTLSGSDIGIIAVGFVVSFLSALFVVKTLIAFVGRHGFTPFGWWRIVVGALGLVGLWLFG
jgi:undecaprenyl-diphosphatase